jgi:hypothetical protein
MDHPLSPVCLFTYNRPYETIKTLEALQKNHLAPRSELFVFSDGPKNEKAAPAVEKVRGHIRGISGFKSVTLFESDMNKGLANSIISGVTKVIDLYGSVIVLEDDLVTSPNFLDFMNSALAFYADNGKIFSISGYTLDLPSLRNNPGDSYVAYRASSWGWGTWKDRWDAVDWKVKDYDRFKYDLSQQIRFMRGGSDMPLMLWKQMNGRIDSWAIRWCFDQFKKDLLTVFPVRSKVINTGTGENATHTKNGARFETTLDNSGRRDFVFDKDPKTDPGLIREFRDKFSVINRLKERLIR